MKRRWLSVVLVLAVAGTGSWAWLERGERVRVVEQLQFEKKQTALAKADAERLRIVVERHEKAVRATKEKTIRSEVERDTARLRGLPFKTPVEYKELAKADIKKTLLQKVAEQYSDADFEKVRLGYVALGLLPEGYPFKDRFIDLLGEQVAAFYDQHAHHLFMFDHAKLESVQNQMILAHELTHALQDQHFTLAKLPLELKNNDDRAIAASALVEGDATLLMYLFMAENLSLQAVGDTVGSAFTQNLEQLNAAPRILKESLLFPYMEGAKFCSYIQSSPTDFTEISAAYARPPASSAQIFHPEKYLANEAPIEVKWPDATLDGAAPVADNVLGELGLRVLFAEWIDEKRAPELATGWRGDRYLVFNGGNSLVLKVIWENDKQAQRFADSAKKMWEKRYQAREEASSATRTRLLGSGRELVISFASPTEVVLIDAPDEKSAGALEEKFAR